MKTLKISIVFLTFNLLCTMVFAQQKIAADSLGLPGDNLNLYAVLDIFQKSETLEGFEKALNNQDSKVNNLDLNGDNKIDYIRVIDNVKGNSHAIVLQVPINQKENQDVAVIDVQKNDEGKVMIQIIGDEKLYGKNYIVEPKQTNEKSMVSGGTPNPGYNGGNNTTNVTNNNYYNNNNYNNNNYNNNNYNNNNYNNNNYNSNNSYNNGGGYGGYYNGYNYWYPVSSWSIIRYMYYPSYVVYISPWSWGFYPTYWSPWAPMFWHSYYYGWIYPNYGYYNGWCYRSSHMRNSFTNGYYGHRRETSATVANRQLTGEYASTYSRPDLAKNTNSSSRYGNGTQLTEGRINSGASQSSNTGNGGFKEKNNSAIQTNNEMTVSRHNEDASQLKNNQQEPYQQQHYSNNQVFHESHNNSSYTSPSYNAPSMHHNNSFSAPTPHYSAPASHYSAPSGGNHSGGASHRGR